MNAPVYKITFDRAGFRSRIYRDEEDISDTLTGWAIEADVGGVTTLTLRHLIDVEASGTPGEVRAG